LTLYGADNADALRGIYLDGVVLDEYAQMSPRAWSEVIRPALSDREGWAIFIGTPMGHGPFFKLYERAKDMPGWRRFMYRASETGILSEAELLAARQEMSPDEYAQEFECSWSAAVRGAYYAKLMDQAEEEGRITKVPYDPTLPVVTAWDLGVNDATVVWFIQNAGPRRHAIECRAYKGSGLPEIITDISRLPYKYGAHIGPHDLEVRELGSGRTRLEIAQSLGVSFIVAPRLPVEEGINAVKAILPTMWFDAEKCADGIEALRMYRSEWDDKRQVFRLKPVHDANSDYADSLRYYAVTPEMSGSALGGSTYIDWNVPINY